DGARIQAAARLTLRGIYDRPARLRLTRRFIPVACRRKPAIVVQQQPITRYRGERSPKQIESAIRPRFVQDSFRSLTGRRAGAALWYRIAHRTRSPRCTSG